MTATTNTVHSELLARQMTVKDWAEKHGYHVNTVRKAINRHVGNPDTRPFGLTTHNILRDLSRDLGMRLHPTVTESEMKGSPEQAA
ncbi:helix-turn-helix domain-containing protein [Endothiovibrio diazotrophicus]